MSQIALTAAPTDAPDRQGSDELVVVPARRKRRWIVPVVLALLGIQALRLVVENPRFQWDVIGHYLFDVQILRGLFLTVWLTLTAMAIGLALGTLLAVMMRSSTASTRWVALTFVWLFRGTPVLVQLVLWYNLAALFPVYQIALPFGPTLLEGSFNDLITPLMAAILGLSLNESAYMAEIVRAGIQSVRADQHDAARALGMTNSLAMRRIILPQALQFIVPPTGNEMIGMLKTTSLVSVIALYDLLYSAQSIYSRTYQTIPLLLVACFWYLVATSVFSLAQRALEQHIAHGADRRRASEGLRFWKTLR